MPLMTTTQIRRQRGTLDLSLMVAFTILLGTKLEISWGRRHRQLPNVRDYICAAAMCRSASYIGLMSGETDSGEWDGKAGGYAIQGHAGAFIRRINGSYFNVVGLPLYETLSLLRGLGFVVPE